MKAAVSRAMLFWWALLVLPCKMVTSTYHYSEMVELAGLLDADTSFRWCMQRFTNTLLMLARSRIVLDACL